MSVFQGRNVVITGGAGFLGREVDQLVQNCDPRNVVIPRRAKYDLSEQDAVRQLMNDAKPEVVLHLAAEVGGIGANMKQPGRFFYSNASMGIHLIEESRRFGVLKYVQVGTVCAYPNHTPVPFREEDLWNGFPEVTNAPYGVAKKMLFVQAKAYREQYGMNAVSVIPVNLYGPGDNFDLETSHVIPALIRKVLEARDRGDSYIPVWGTGSASREFLFVRDAARGIILAAEKYNGAEPVNIGTGSEIQIRELVPLICELCEFKGEVVWEKNKPDGQPRRCLDTSRAKELFDFEAKTSLREGLVETIQWYKETRHQDVTDHRAVA